MNFGPFLCPRVGSSFNSVPGLFRICNIVPPGNRMDKLADVVETFIYSTHERSYKDSNQSYNFTVATVDLCITALH